MAHQNAKRYEEALTLFQMLERVQPTHPEVLCGLGGVLCELGHLEEGVSKIELAAAVRPDAITLALLAIARASAGRIDEAIEISDRVLRLQPSYPIARYNRALWLLAKGEWGRGWADYRWGRVSSGRPLRDLAPQWDGRPVESLYVWAEQGAGDTFQFARFLSSLPGKVGRLVVEVRESEARVIQRMGVASALCVTQPHGGFGETCEAHCSLMELPYILGITHPSMVARSPYLARPKIVMEGQTRPRVGVSWKGNPEHPHDRQRSASAELFAPLMSVPGVDFVSLMPGESFSPVDWEATSEVLASLDMVVAVDTGVCHLAGAMGVPCLTWVAHACDWRWATYEQGDDQWWYTNMKMLRQEREGDWSEPARRSKECVEQLAATWRHPLKER